MIIARISRGFALVEMLVGLAVLSVIATAMLSGLHFGGRVWERVSVSSSGAEEVLASQAFVRSLMEHCYPEVEAKGGNEWIAFAGSVDQFSCLAPLPVALGQPGLRWVRIGFLPEAGGELRLVWADAISEHQAPPLNDGNGLALLGNVATASFSYFDRSDSVGYWRTDWSERATLPLAIRLDLSFSSGGPRQWPSLVAVPKLTHEASCVFDPVSSGCRRRQ